MSVFGLQASLFKKLFKSIIRLNCGEAKKTMLADEHALRALIQHSPRPNANLIPDILLASWEQTQSEDTSLNLDSIRVYSIPNFLLSSIGLAIANPKATSISCASGTTTQQSKQGDCLAVPSYAPNIWFVGRDVAASIGYVDTKSAVQDNVSNSNKIKVVIPTPNGKKSVNIINLDGVKELAYKSKTAKAFQFRHILEANTWHPSPIGDVISIVNIQSPKATDTSNSVTIGDLTSQVLQSDTNPTNIANQIIRVPIKISEISNSVAKGDLTSQVSQSDTIKNNVTLKETSDSVSPQIPHNHVLTNYYMSDIEVITINTPIGKIRTLKYKSNTWYVLVDICKILGIKNPSLITREILTNQPPMKYIGGQSESLPPDYIKIHRSLFSPTFNKSIQSSQGEEITVLSLNGFITMLFSSRKPLAKEFRKYFLNQLSKVTKNPISDNQISTISSQLDSTSNSVAKGDLTSQVSQSDTNTISNSICSIDQDSSINNDIENSFSTDNLNTPWGSIRTVKINTDIWYVLVDVCKIIGIKNSRYITETVLTCFSDFNDILTPRRFNRRGPVPPDYSKIPRSLVSNQYKTNTQKGLVGEEITIITAKGLLKIMCSSKKPIARIFIEYFLDHLSDMSLYTQNSISDNQISTLSSQLKSIIDSQTQILSLIGNQTNQSLNDIQQTLEDNTIQVTRLISTVSTTALAYRFNFKVPQFYKWLIYKGLVYKDEDTKNYMPTEKAIKLGLAVIKSSAHKPYVHWLIEPMQDYISQCMSNISEFNLEWLEATENKSCF